MASSRDGRGDSKLPTAPASSSSKRRRDGSHAGDVGKVLAGRYRLDRALSAGGMGEVFVATDLVLDRTVAVKRIVRVLELAPGNVERFLREARTTARVDNPHVVKVHDFGRDEEGHPFYVMELLEGHSLSELLDTEKRLPQARAIKIVLQILDALETMHARGVLHRDLKPNNVMVQRRNGGEDLAKVVDFGIAKVLDQSTMTAANAVMGTFQYLPPEAFRGATPAVGWDVYAAGCVLFALLTGQEPWPASTGVELAAAKEGSAPDARALAPDLAPALAEVVAHAMAAEAKVRFQTAREFRHALLDLEVRQLPIGSLIDERYRVDGRLAQRRRSVIYRVVDTVASSPLALKLLVDSDGEDEAAVRFEREGRLGQMLRHPNLVHVVEAGGTWRNHPYLTMELVDQAEPIERLWGRLDWEQWKKLLRQSGDALDYLASEGVVHRDVSPSNILGGVDGVVKLLDLGCAREAGSYVTGSELVSVIGSVGYIAPEQLEQPQAALPASDLWGLAAIVYQALTGTAPHFKPDQMADMRAAAPAANAEIASHKPLRPPSDINLTVSGELSAVVMKALAPRPAERFETCAAFVHALSHADAAGLELAYSEPAASAAPSTDQPSSRHRRWWLIVVAALLALGAIGALAALAVRSSEQRSEPPPARVPQAAPAPHTEVAPAPTLRIPGVVLEASSDGEVASLKPPPAKAATHPFHRSVSRRSASTSDSAANFQRSSIFLEPR